MEGKNEITKLNTQFLGGEKKKQKKQNLPISHHSSQVFIECWRDYQGKKLNQRGV